MDDIYIYDSDGNKVIDSDGNYVVRKIAATSYNVELRDRDGYLKAYLTPKVSDISWEWNRIGGCGRCNIKLAIKYRKIRISAGDDIQIRYPGQLLYRGWVSSVTPILGLPQSVTIDVRGYFDRLEKLIIQEGYDKKEYSNISVSGIVEDIIDDIVVGNSPITKGTIDGANFGVDYLTFKTNVKEALATLAGIEGKVEYGVDENLVFFWRKQSEVLRQKFIVGNNVSSFERKVNWDDLVNEVFFEGGTLDDGTTFLMSVKAQDSQDRYFVAQGIVSNSSIITSSVATRYLNAYLKQYARPQLALNFKVVNTALRLEDTIPIGKVAVYDKDYDQSAGVWGIAANGGSNFKWGRKENGGSNAIWGGVYKDQVDRIAYSLSNTIGRFNIDITLGSSITEATARINQIDTLLSNLRQR